jgi:hypothetical protein
MTLTFHGTSPSGQTLSVRLDTHSTTNAQGVTTNTIDNGSCSTS